MGKGKTSFLTHYLDFLKKPRVLFISQRKTFTNFICSSFSDYGLVNYQKIKNGDYDEKMLCIQIESIHKIKKMQYDIIIIDEVETVLNQFSSDTMAHISDCWKKMKELVLHAEYCVCLDAFITIYFYVG